MCDEFPTFLRHVPVAFFFLEKFLKLINKPNLAQYLDPKMVPKSLIYFPAIYNQRLMAACASLS